MIPKNGFPVHEGFVPGLWGVDLDGLSVDNLSSFDVGRVGEKGEHFFGADDFEAFARVSGVGVFELIAGGGLGGGGGAPSGGSRGAGELRKGAFFG